MNKKTDKIKVYVPLDTTAVSLGADIVAKKISKLAKENNQEVEIIRNGSWGMFWLEPLVEVEINNERIAYGPVAPEVVEHLFTSKFLEGGNHPLRLGDVQKLPFLQKQTRLCFERVGKIDPVNIEDYKKHNGYTVLEQTFNSSPQHIIEEVKEGQLRGRGGAAFPTWIKLNSTLEAQGDVKYVVCNADEGDSGTFSDRMVAEGDPFSLIEAMTIMGKTTGANEGYIYLRSEYPVAKVCLTKAIEEARKHNYLGKNIMGTGFDFDIHLRIGAGSYVCGEETALINSLEGKRGIVRKKPPLPVHEGLFGKPTILCNLITMVSLLPILRMGGKEYAKFGYERSRGTNPFQLAGNVRYSGIVEVPFGITVQELVTDFGGGTFTGKPIKNIQIGGPLGYHMSPSLFDMPLDYEAFLKIEGHIGHGGVVVMDDTAHLDDLARYAFRFCEIESCGKCTPCRIGSVRGREIMDEIIAGKDRAKNLALIEELCETMEFGSMCAMGGMTPVPVRSALKNFSEEFYQ